MHRYYSDKYYKILLTPDGIEGPSEQIIGSVITQDIGLQATFSPDGSRFCFLLGEVGSITCTLIDVQVNFRIL